MLIHELTPDDCRELLARSSLGRLACARFDQPYVVPIHFSLDAERSCVYAFSTVGQKILWMRENPQVCLEVEEIRDKETGRLCWRSGGTRRFTSIRRKPRLDAAPSSCSCSAETGGSRRLGGLRVANTRTWSSIAFRSIDSRVAVPRANATDSRRRSMAGKISHWWGCLRASAEA